MVLVRSKGAMRRRTAPDRRYGRALLCSMRPLLRPEFFDLDKLPNGQARGALPRSGATLTAKLAHRPDP